MATIKITGPDGKVARITPPAGATQEQINAKIAEVQANWGVDTGPKTTALGALATGLGQAAFSFGDEIEAGVRAAFDPEKTYDDIIPEVRERVKASAEEHPFAFYGGQIGGSIALPLGAAKAGLSLIDKAAKAGKGLKGVAQAGAIEGAGYGAAYGLGAGEGGAQARLESAAGGGLLGGAIGGAAPVVIGGAQAGVDAVRRNIRKVTDPMKAATDDVARAVIADDDVADVIRATGGKPLRLNEDAVAARMYAEGQTPAVRLVDTGGENTRALMRAAGNNSPEAREMIGSVLAPRKEGQAVRAIDFLKGLTGRQGNAYQAGEDLAQAARKSNDPVYRVARELGDQPIWTRNLERLTGSNIVRDAMQKATKTVDDRAITEGFGVMNSGVKWEPNTGVMEFTAKGRKTFPNLAFWDETKRNLDTVRRNALATGDKNTADIATRTIRELRGELDKVVPQYKTARGVAQTFFDAEDALEAGQSFAKGKFDLNEAKAAIGKFGPKEREMFEEGFVAQYLDDVSRSKDNQNLVNRLMNSERDREVFATALGPEKARKLEAFLHVENVMMAANNAMGNSTTARQLVELGLAGGGGLIAGGGNPLSPEAIITAALLKWAPGRINDRVKQKYALNMAQLLMSKEPEALTKAVAELSKPNNMTALRNLTKALTGAGASVGSGYAAQQAPAGGE